MQEKKDSVVMTEDFIACWNAAGAHLQRQSKEGLAWMRAHMGLPFMEHLSFRLGNQLFFVRIEDADGQVSMPGTREDLMTIAEACKGHPCIMQMRFGFGSWYCTGKGWGLTSAKDGSPVNPPDLVTDEKIELTDWELHDWAVQIVVQNLTQSGETVTSWNSIPHLQPSIWITAQDGSDQWVVVKALRYPTKAEIPDNMAAIERRYASRQARGNFAYVMFSNAAQPLEKDLPEGEKALPLYRGEQLYTHFSGLIDPTDEV